MPAITHGQEREKKAAKRHKFPLPELGADAYVWLRPLSAQEVLKLRGSKAIADSEAEADPKGGFTLLARAITDDDGEPIFSDGEDVQQNLHCDMANLLAMIDKVAQMAGVEKKN